MIAAPAVRALFERRDMLAEALAAADRDIAAARREWSDAHGYRVTIRAEALRQEVRA